MTGRSAPGGPRRFRVRLGHAVVEVCGASAEEAVRAARERLCLDLPRLWDVIAQAETARFEVIPLDEAEPRRPRET